MPAGSSREKPETTEAAAEIESPSPPRRAPEPAIRTISSRELLAGGALLRIEHDGECYTLRRTRNNRLILTK